MQWEISYKFYNSAYKAYIMIVLSATVGWQPFCTLSLLMIPGIFTQRAIFVVFNSQGKRAAKREIFVEQKGAFKVSKKLKIAPICHLEFKCSWFEYGESCLGGSNFCIWQKSCIYPSLEQMMTPDIMVLHPYIISRVLANNFLSYCNKSCNNWDLLNCNNFACNNEFWIIAIKLLRNEFAITLQ